MPSSQIALPLMPERPRGKCRVLQKDVAAVVRPRERPRAANGPGTAFPEEISKHFVDGFEDRFAVEGALSPLSLQLFRELAPEQPGLAIVVFIHLVCGPVVGVPRGARGDLHGIGVVRGVVGLVGEPRV
eukprot:CAMPEP_0172654224 /NCGR_PEP_ID=MMETSP1068-20121228/244224_1 /TAXON_ID=35684 /ORGANISM="Pseudopedinella elastica, Strain CCMP716" /LENGTH=128 /DNA_ID=CAMNT_0013468665 /DNA_START=216 /DNA_END=602 /DNA_ORIENTATION=-